MTRCVQFITVDASDYLDFVRNIIQLNKEWYKMGPSLSTSSTHMAMNSAIIKLSSTLSDLFIHHGFGFLVGSFCFEWHKYVDSAFAYSIKPLINRRSLCALLNFELLVRMIITDPNTWHDKKNCELVFGSQTRVKRIRLTKRMNKNCIHYLFVSKYSLAFYYSACWKLRNKLYWKNLILEKFS